MRYRIRLIFIQIVNPAVIPGNITLVIDGFSPSSSITAWTLNGGTNPKAGNTPYQPALFSPVQVCVRGWGTGWVVDVDARWRGAGA